MKYSFAFVLCIGALILQCSARPQAPVDAPSATIAPPETSSPAAESVMADAESATEVTNAGEQVVFDEGEPVVGATNDDADADTPTTSMPEEESQQDEVTTTPPCTGEDCSSAVVMEDAASTDDAPAAPSDDDATTETTTQQSS